MVPTAATRVWQVDSDELWAIALANLRREEVDVHPAPTGTLEFYAAYGGPFTATNVRRLDELVGRPMPYGALVGLPSQRVLHVTVLKQMDDVLHVPSLEARNKRVRESEDVPRCRLVDDIFWWYDGELSLLQVRHKKDAAGVVHSVSVTSSPRFKVVARGMPASREFRHRDLDGWRP
jgi:hypothetical protein